MQPIMPEVDNPNGELYCYSDCIINICIIKLCSEIFLGYFSLLQNKPPLFNLVLGVLEYFLWISPGGTLSILTENSGEYRT